VAAAPGACPIPLHQFEIKRLIPFELFGFDASFTNSALFMLIAATLITLFTVYAMRRGSLVPTRLQSVAELSYEFVANMVRDNVGTDGMKYFPFVFTLFMFVLC
jgi:F-type H+-transporting ATPase subunit a